MTQHLETPRPGPTGTLPPSSSDVDPEQVRRYWDEVASEYDDYPDHGLLDPDLRAAWKDLLRTWLPPSPSRVADLACGTGSMSVLAAELGHEVSGVDLSGEMVALARAKTAPFGRAAEVVQGDAGAPPLAPGAFDVVLGRHILWTLPDPLRALRAWVGLLRPGGRLVLVGIPGDDKLALSHGTARRKGLTIRMARRMKHTYPRAIALVEAGQVDLDDLVSHRFDLPQTAEAYALNMRYPPGLLKAVVDCAPAT
jgi:ubiquinone/menaquinone biosynthesis C-methylase UbiE